MPSWNEDVALEVEALNATYGEELVQNDGSVSMLLQPSSDTPNNTYVQCQLVLGVADSAYPEQSPNIQLQDVKGLGSNRLAALQAHLESEAASMLGEMVLGQLFESAKDWLTENNWPEGEQQLSASSHVCIMLRQATRKYSAFTSVYVLIW